MELLIPYEKNKMIGRQTDQITKDTPTYNIDIRNENLCSDVISYYKETGETKDIKYNQPYLHTCNDYITTYKIIKKPYGPLIVKCISVGPHSKMLKADYLKGISHNTIKQIYDEIIDQKVIYLEYSDFIKSIVNMVDIKRDVIIENISIREAIKYIKSKINKDIKDCKIHPNGNFSIGKRKLADNSNIYIKFYDKKSELESNSTIFNSNHNIDCPDNLLRCEITLHREQLNEYFKHNEIEYNETLFSLLDNLEIHGESIMRTIINNHFDNLDKYFDINSSQLDQPQLTNKDQQNRGAEFDNGVRELVNLIMSNYRTIGLKDATNKTINLIDQILPKPLGIDKTRHVKKLISEYYRKSNNFDTFNKGQ